MSKMFIVTNCDPKRVSASERSVKNIYLVKDPKPAISFAHKGSNRYDIAKRAKCKKATLFVFEEEVPTIEIIGIITAVTREMNGNSPKFLHINKNQVLVNVEPISGHEEIYKKYIEKVA